MSHVENAFVALELYGLSRADRLLMAPCVYLTTLLSCSPRRYSLANLSAAPSLSINTTICLPRLIFDCLSCFTALPHIVICLCWCASTGGRSCIAAAIVSSVAKKISSGPLTSWRSSDSLGYALVSSFYHLLSC